MPATEYDPETELKRLRREKEGKIKKIEEARKKKKQQESEWTCDSKRIFENVCVVFPLPLSS